MNKDDQEKLVKKWAIRKDIIQKNPGDCFPLDLKRLI